MKNKAIEMRDKNNINNDESLKEPKNQIRERIENNLMYMSYEQIEEIDNYIKKLIYKNNINNILENIINKQIKDTDIIYMKGEDLFNRIIIQHLKINDFLDEVMSYFKNNGYDYSDELRNNLLNFIVRANKDEIVVMRKEITALFYFILKLSSITDLFTINYKTSDKDKKIDLDKEYKINSKNLKKYRTINKYSQNMVGVKIGKSSTYIFKLEKEQIKNVKGSIIKCLADIFKIDPLELIKNE